MGGGRQAGVEEDGVVPGVGEGAPGLVCDVEGGEGCGVGEGEGAGVVVDTVGEGVWPGVGRLGAGVGLGEAGVVCGDDAGLAFGVGVDAGKDDGGTGRRPSQPERAPEHGGERPECDPPPTPPWTVGHRVCRSRDCP